MSPTTLHNLVGRCLRTLLAASAIMGCADSPAHLTDAPFEDAVTAVDGITTRIRYASDLDVLQVATDAQVQQIFVRYRRGHPHDLSCDDMAQMSPLTLGDDGVWRGPEAPADLLVSFYDDRWDRAEITAEMLAQAQQGTDSLIELCLTGDFGVVPVQEALGSAMDTPAEAVLPDAEQMLTGYGLTQGGSPIHGKQRYAEVCVEELGDIPFFPDLGAGRYGTYDCRAGTEIPVRVTPKTGTDSQGRPVFGATTIATVSQSTCDEPQYLGYGCEVGARVSHAQNSRGTDWVLLCRKVQDAAAGRFDDIAMIGHNPRTGKTCFFQNAIGNKNDGTAVSHPADVARWADTWRQGVDGQSCIGCHDQDPFIHTPWIDRAQVVPFRGAPDAPYSVVDAVGQGWTMPMHLTEPGSQACTSCHRVGAWDVRRWTSVIEGLVPQFEAEKTEYAKQPEQTYWMPPGASYASHADWKASAYSAAVQVIDDCIDDPSSCAYEDLPTGKLRLRLTESTQHCALGMAPEAAETPQVIPDEPLFDSWTWLHPDLASALSPTDAPFMCGQDGVEIEVIPSRSGPGVHLRTQTATGDTCYLITEDEGYGYTPVFGASIGLKWNCGLSYGSRFDIAHTGEQVRLRALRSVGACGIVVPSQPTSERTSSIDCASQGTPLYLEAQTQQRWNQERVATGAENLYGPFDVVPLQEVVAEITPDGGGDADLAVWWGTADQPTVIACRPYTSTSQERCTLTVPAQETHFRVGVHGYTSAGYNLKVTYAEPD